MTTPTTHPVIADIDAFSDVRHLPLILDEGEEIDLGSAIEDAWKMFRFYRDEANRLDKAAKDRQSVIHAAMGTASVGRFADGSRLVRKIVNLKAYECPASTYATPAYKGEGK